MDRGPDREPNGNNVAQYMGMGLALDNVALGICMGIAIGAGIGGAFLARRDEDDG